MTTIQKENGKKGVRIEDTVYDTELAITRNGWHWTGQVVTIELLRMVRDAINEYLEQKGIDPA